MYYIKYMCLQHLYSNLFTMACSLETLIKKHSNFIIYPQKSLPIRGPGATPPLALMRGVGRPGRSGQRVSDADGLAHAPLGFGTGAARLRVC